MLSSNQLAGALCEWSRTPPQPLSTRETRCGENELLRCKMKAGPLPGLVRHDRQLAAVRQQFWDPFDGCAL